MSVATNQKLESIAARLKNLRMQKGFSQKGMAEAAGINRVQYNRYEMAEMLPSTESLSKIADVLEVTVDYLLEGREDGAVVAKIQDQDLLKIFTDIEKLPEDKKAAVKSILESVVRDTKHQLIAS
jgi:transcriptional regulator with XRE-family HTH domain